MRLPRWRRPVRRTRDEATFCESCAQVCDAACRSATIHDRAQVQMLRYRAGLP